MIPLKVLVSICGVQLTLAMKSQYGRWSPDVVGKRYPFSQETTGLPTVSSLDRRRCSSLSLRADKVQGPAAAMQSSQSLEGK